MGCCAIEHKHNKSKEKVFCEPNISDTQNQNHQ